MDDKTPEYKIILLGDPGVGKTTFFLRLREQEFVDTEQRPSASIGVDDLLYEHTVDDTRVKVGRRVRVSGYIPCRKVYPTSRLSKSTPRLLA